MAITLKDIALGNKRMADQPFTSYREGGAKSAGGGSSINDIKAIAEALKTQQAPDLSEREIESNRILSQIQVDIEYLPKIYKEVVDMNKSLKKTMLHIADVLESSGGGGFLSSLLGTGAGVGLGAKMARGGKGISPAKYSPKGRFIPKVGTWAGELVKDTRLAGQQLKGIGGKAIDAGVKVTKSAASAGANKWKPFLTWLEKRSPKLFAKISARLLSGAATIALPGPGWIWTAVAWLGSISMAVEVYQLWKEYKKSEPTAEDKPPKVEQDAKKPKVLNAKDAPKETVLKSSLTGKVAGDKADGPITLNGQTLNPGDPGYDEAEKKLVAGNKKLKEDRAVALGAKPKVKKKPSIFAAAMNSIKGFFGGKSKADQDMAFDDENGLSQSEANKYAGGFAEGGKIPKGKVGIVGEKGPEVIQGPADITPTKKWLKENYKTTDEFWTATTGQPWGGKGFQELEMAYLGQEHRRKLADPKYKSPGRGDEWERIARYLDTPEGRKFQYDKGLGSQAQYRALDEAYRQRDLQNIAAGDLQGPKVDPSKTTMSQALYDESRGAVNFGDNGKIKEANAIALDPSMKGDQLAAKSSENDMAKLNAGKSNAAPTNVVNAPTTVNKSTQTNVIKTPVRNQDSSYADYQRSKYAT